jgi:hypothetical protein
VRAGPTSAAVDAAGVIYYGISNAVFAFTPQGQVQWVFRSDYPPNPPFDSSGYAPVVGADGTVYATVGSTLYAIVATNGPSTGPWPVFRGNARHTGKIEKPLLQQPQKRSDAGFEFQLYPHQLGLTYTIESSSNLDTWTPLTSFVATNVPMDVVDRTATNADVRFYRALSPP